MKMSEGIYPSELKMPSCWAVWETGLRRCKSSPYQRIGLRFAPCTPIPQTTHQPSIFSSDGYREACSPLGHRFRGVVLGVLAGSRW